MYQTKNDLPAHTRAEVIEILNARLADSIDLMHQAKQAHWNVKGPSFIALHKLFDEINEEVEDYVADIAERAVQLGGVAEGTARMVAKRSSLAEYPAKAVDGRGCRRAWSWRAGRCRRRIGVGWCRSASWSGTAGMGGGLIPKRGGEVHAPRQPRWDKGPP